MRHVVTWQASLNGTIVNMAQNFVGSNNVNFLYPSGQFGTRIMGGKDAASARYIFTRLEEITRQLFHPNDDPLLAYLEEDGQRIEPDYYVPIIPTVLVSTTTANRPVPRGKGLSVGVCVWRGWISCPGERQRRHRHGLVVEHPQLQPARPHQQHPPTHQGRGEPPMHHSS